MKIKMDLEEALKGYQKAADYNHSIDLYETVEKNENFYIGRQWEGLNAPDLEKPVLNFLKRVVAYFIAMLVSDDVTVMLNSGNEKEDEVLEKEVFKVLENTKLKAKHRDLLRNMAVHGDGCFYFYWNYPNAQSDGEIAVDVVENTRVLFANPYSAEVQTQPQIYITATEPVENVEKQMKKFGGKESEMPCEDDDFYSRYTNVKTTDGFVTTIMLLKKHPESGEVWAMKFCENAVIKNWWNTGYRLYPVAYASWEKVRGSYHGQGVITSLIPNQIFVNKLWAMAMEQVKATAFPKVIYNRSALPEGWKAGAGKAIGVYGNPNEAVASSFKAHDMSAQVMELVDRTIAYTREFMGASDAALGNVAPNNTSAIIAVQKASAAPLELQRLTFYQFVEDYIRIILDIIRVHYGEVKLQGQTNGNTAEYVDLSALNYSALELTVDVGASAYWSELMQVETMDNLFGKGIVTDAVTYLENIPESYIKNKKVLIKKLEEQKENMNAQFLQ